MRSAPIPRRADSRWCCFFGGARTQLRIRLLRQPGVEIADKTAKLPLPDTAVQILLRTPLAPLRKGRWVGVSRLGGVVFLVAHSGCTDTVIAVSRPVTYGKTGTAGDRWSPLRVKIGSDQDPGNSHHGKLCYISAKILRCTLAFPLRGRCRRSRRMRCFFNSGFTFYLCYYCVGPTGHLRQNRHSGRPMVAPTNRFERGQSFCTLSAGSGALAVFSALSIPGYRN